MARDTRQEKAERLFADRGQWLRCRLSGGRQAFGLPSGRQPGLYYLTDGLRCTCPAYRLHGLTRSRVGHDGLHVPCSHLEAVNLLLRSFPIGMGA
jgi:hypothetical protein